MKQVQQLHSPHFQSLPLGSIQPLGWLANQLHLQADGLSGHLDEFWPDVKDSGWFGGQAESWERAPYWLDGLVPLAFLLDEVGLKEKVHKYVDYILVNQAADGWLGPGDPQQDHKSYDIWALFLILKVLIQYADALTFAKDTYAEKITEAVEKCLHRIDQHIDKSPLFNWGQFRWFEALIPILWLYERTNADWLIDLAVKLQAQGFHWGEFFKRWPLTEVTPKGCWTYMGHVVNNAMAIKAHALWWRITGEPTDQATVYDMIEKLDRQHGMVTGVFSGDECLAGSSPTQGTELCAVVEYAYSLEVLLSLFGDPTFGDRLEKIVFNALPATFAPDMWSHQYDQQVNQVECSSRADRTWVDNGPDSNIFGLEPNYGCCTANLSQGWPKFATHLWMVDDQGGLDAVAYAPSRVNLEIQGVPVTVTLETEYPFRQDLRFLVKVAGPVRFSLNLRIPAWSTSASLRIGSDPAIQPGPGKFYPIDRQWNSTTAIHLTLPMQPVLSRRYRGSVSILRGPLVYALKVGEEWRRIHADQSYRELPHADWEVYPTTAWNYALQVSEGTIEKDITFKEQPVAYNPFSPEGAPITASVTGRRVPEWQMENGSASDVPRSPVATRTSPVKLTLIPYGCTNLRITEFPTTQ